jgi:hypothetical protein
MQSISIPFWLSVGSNQWLLSLYGSIFSAIFASFYCVLFERIPLGLSINGRSKCSCGRQLSITENIPIFGWISNSGVAHCCGSLIAKHYLYAEILSATAGALLGYFFGFAAIVTFIIILGVATTILSFIKRRENIQNALSGQIKIDEKE